MSGNLSASLLLLSEALQIVPQSVNLGSSGERKTSSTGSDSPFLNLRLYMLNSFHKTKSQSTTLHPLQGFAKPASELGIPLWQQPPEPQAHQHPRRRSLINCSLGLQSGQDQSCQIWQQLRVPFSFL